MNNKIKTILFASLIVAMILPFSMGNHAIAETFDGQIDTNNGYTYNTDSSGEDKLSDFTGKEITTNYTVLNRAHSDVTNIMIDQSEKPLEVYNGPDIPIVMAYIDDDTLVIGLDPMAMYFDPPIEPELLQHILDIDEPIEIQYVTFEDEASASQTKSWQDKYTKSCMPVKSGYQNVCKIYKNVMKRLNISLPTGTTSSTTTSTTIPTQTNTGNPCDTSARSTACYYYKQYEQKCTNGKTYKRCNTYATQIKNAGYALPVSSGTQTVTPTVTTPTYELNNVQAAKSGDNITLSWDAPTGFKVKYYKIYVTDNDRYYKYKGKINKSATSYTLSDVTEGKSYKFKIKLYYENTRGSTSVKYFYSNSVDVPRIVIDRLAPVITVPSGMNVKTPNLSGDTVRYIVDAKDNVDPRVSVTCSPASGTKFSVGSTTVSCSATDTAGNTATKTFTVSVVNGKQPNCKSPINENAGICQAIGIVPPTNILRGGEAIWADGKVRDPMTLQKKQVDGGHSTIGIALMHNGEKHLVLSSHSVSHLISDREIYIKQFPLLDIKVPVGTIVKDANVYTSTTPSTADVALLKVTDDNISFKPDEILTQNSIFDVTLNVTKKGGVNDMNKGTKLSIAGIKNDGSGGLQYTNATVTMSGYTLIEQAIANYPSQKGDSGSPIYRSLGGNDVQLVGIHAGKGCNITHVDSQNFSILGCDKYNRNAIFKVFSPWENIVSTLGLK